MTEKQIRTKRLKKEWFEQNKEKVRLLVAVSKKEKQKINVQYVEEYISEHPCVDCGNPNPLVLEFDHIIGEKKCNVSKMVWKGYALKTLIKEIEKCEVRCANCHKIATHNRRQLTDKKPTKYGL